MSKHDVTRRSSIDGGLVGNIQFWLFDQVKMRGSCVKKGKGKKSSLKQKNWYRVVIMIDIS